MCGLLTPDSGSGTCLGFDILQAARRDQAPRRLHDAALLVLGRPLDPREPGFRRPHLRDAQAARGRGTRDRGAWASPAARRSSPGRSRAAGSSASRWPRACCTSRSCCCSTSRPRASTPGARREFWEELHALAARGISVLVSTHYMDEAERCHKLAYIAYGKLMAQGTARGDHRRPEPDDLGGEGDDLAGDRRAAAGRSRASSRSPPSARLCTSPAATPRRWRRRCAVSRPAPARERERARTGLEDVFIHLTERAVDNYGLPR